MQAPDSPLYRYNDITHEVGYVEHSFQQVLIASGFSDISLHGFEDIHFKAGLWENGKMLIRLLLRTAYWRYVRFIRKVCGITNPVIMHPVFYAAVRR
jgi:hypothetical protein